MSIDLNWETLTTGPDGDALALRIRDFIHSKFQTVKLPRFIKSVTVHGFEFGSIPPDLELKDITDPLPDFYEAETGSDDEDSSEGDDGDEDVSVAVEDANSRAAAAAESRRRAGAPTSLDAIPPGLASRLMSPAAGRSMPELASPFLGMGTPGFMGGGPNRHYFQSHLAAGGGFSGTQTPLAAVAGGKMAHGWFGDRTACSSPAPRYDSGDDDVTPSHSRNASQSSISEPDGPASPSASPAGRLATGRLREKSSVSTLAANSRPPTRDALSGSAIAEESGDEDEDEHDGDGASPSEPGPPRPGREARVEDMQAVFRIRYAGDIKLRLTAVILLDYPMPSFVGIPIKLNITGLAFDGVGVLAHIRKRLHFCFLSPEDALAAVGPERDEEEVEGSGSGGSGSGSGSASGSTGGGGRKTKFGGLLQEVKVESEIGEREAGKQSLKNVGKVERFVLEQVRRIFEDEFVYPSFWTFLV